MKISLNWIKEFVNIPAKYGVHELAELLTVRTCEVEGVEDQGRALANIVVGRVAALRPHPNADKLRLVDTDIGGKNVQIVCGGENLTADMPVAVALPGARVKWHGEGELIELKETKIRGETSFGMICAEEEIGLPALTKTHGVTICDLAHHFATAKIAPSKAGTPLSAALGQDDIIFEIDNKSITHRPDLWGHYGLAREFGAFLNQKLKPYEDASGIKKFHAPKKGESVKIKIANTEISPRFTAAIVTGIKIGPSPDWLQKRLNACGIRPVNNVVDITNFVMLELGQPMHAFDRKIVETDCLEARFATDGEIITTLDHKKRKLNNNDAIISNGKRTLGLAGIIGGLNSEISPRTTEIIFEAANWNPIMIRKTSQRHGIRSDAAQRFEKSLDPELTLLAVLRACELITQICPASNVMDPITDIYPKKSKPIYVTVDTERLQNKIGTKITMQEMISHLKALGFDAKITAKDKLKITVPSFRATKDINIEDDIVEEIARMHGYEKIVPSLPSMPIRLPAKNHERTQKHISRDILSLALGFTETSHYSFYGDPEIRKCMLPEAAHILLENPLTEDQTHMRVSLIPHLLKAVFQNLRYCENFRLYEIGRTYIKTSDYFPREEKFIAGVIVKPAGGEEEIFYDGLGNLTEFLRQMNVPKFRIDQAKNPPPYAHPAACAAVYCEKEEIAYVFEIHPLVLKNYDITSACAAFEINFTRLAALNPNEIHYKPIPRFPGIELDVSILVDKKTPVREIQELIRHTDAQLITNIKLIDIFEDKKLGENKKSFTFRVLLQSQDRTLTDEEMKGIQGRIFKVLQNAGFAIRGL